jgi:hypothetical protein
MALRKWSAVIGGVCGLLSGFYISDYAIIAHRNRQSKLTNNEPILVNGTIPRETAKSIFNRTAANYELLARNLITMRSKNFETIFHHCSIF